MCGQLDGCNTPSLLAFEEYLKFNPSLAPSSKKEYYNIVKDFVRVGYAADIQGFSRYLTEHNYSLVKVSLRQYAKFLKDKELIQDLADLKVRYPAPKPRDITTYEEFIKVLNSMQKEHRFIARFLLYTGARLQEPFTVVREDLYPDGKVIIRSLRSNKWRTVYLPDDFFRELVSYLDETKGILPKQFIFYDHLTSSSKMKSKWFDIQLNKAAVRVIGKRIPTHDFRRYCATFLYEKTKDIQFVKRVIGHSSILTTYKYTKYADKGHDLKRAKRLLSELTLQQKTQGTE